MSRSDKPTALEMLKEVGYCPRFNNIRLLSAEAVEILDNKDVLEKAEDSYGEDAMLLIVNNQSYKIPSILTSRGTFHFLGFTKSRSQELWNFLKEPEAGAFPPPPPIDEFGNRMMEYVDNIINTVGLWSDKSQLKSSVALLDTLGLTKEVQLRDLEQSFPPAGPGLGRRTETFQLQQVCPNCVLAMAKRYIKRRWMLLKKMNSLILSEEEGWWEKMVKEFTQSPIDSHKAYTTIIEDLGFIAPHEKSYWVA